MATTRAMGQKPYQRNKKYGRPIRQNPPSPKPKKAMSEQQAIERLGLRNLSPRSKKRVIQGKAPVANMSLENYGAMVLRAYQETEAEKIQAAYRGMRNRKKVRKMKVNQLEKKALKLAQRRNLLQEEDRIRGELNAMSPNSPSPPRARANPKPRGFGARASRKITQLYTNGRAKRIRDKKRLYKKKMMKIATKKPPKRKRPRQAQKPRKKKKPTRTTNSPTIAQIQRNLLAANSPTIAQIQRNLLKKKYALTDLVTGKKKTFTKKGWYDRAVAKQQSLRVRICA